MLIVPAAATITLKRAQQQPRRKRPCVIPIAAPPIQPHKGRGRATMAETALLERRELIQPRKGQCGREHERRPGDIVEPRNVMRQIFASLQTSLDKGINDETRIGPNQKVA